MAYSGFDIFGPSTFLQGKGYRNLPAGQGAPEDIDPDFERIESVEVGAKKTPKTAQVSTSSAKTDLLFPTLGQSTIYNTRGSYGLSDVSDDYADVSFLTPTTDMPRMGAYPEYIMPEMDRSRISELTELSMGAPMGRLRQGLNRALIESRYSTNPNVRGLARKRALSGYGEGIADIRTGAHREALSEYMPEFQAATGKAAMEYQGGIGRINTIFQAAMNNYFRTMQQTKKRVPVEELGGRRQRAAFSPYSTFGRNPFGG